MQNHRYHFLKNGCLTGVLTTITLLYSCSSANVPANSVAVWSSPERMESPTTTTRLFNSSVAMNDAGKVIIAATKSDVTYSHYYDLNEWNTTTHTPSCGTNDCDYAKAVIDNTDQLLISWHDYATAYQELWIAENRSGSWVYRAMCSTGGADDCRMGEAAISDNGSAFTTYNQANDYLIRHYLSGTWQNGPQLNPTGSTVTSSYRSSPINAMDSSGNAIAVWTDDASALYKAEYRSGSWVVPASSSDHISTSNARYPTIAMGNDGSAIIAWQQSNQIYFIEYRSGAWSGAISINPTSTLVSGPKVAIADDGSALIVWLQNDGSGTAQVYKSQYVNGAWSHPNGLEDNISPNGAAAQDFDVAMNNSKAIIIWTQRLTDISAVFNSEYRIGTWNHPTDLNAYISDISSQNSVPRDAEQPHVAISASGRAIETWVQADASGIKAVYRRTYGF